MTNDKFKPTNKQFNEPFVPKTYEQFILEDKDLSQQDLYPDLDYQDISSSKGYGPCYNSSYCKCHLQRRIDIFLRTNGWFYTDSLDTRDLMEGVENVWAGGAMEFSGSRQYKAKTLRIRSISDYNTVISDWNRSDVKSLQIVGEFWRNSNPKGVHSTFANRLSEIKRILDDPNENAERSFGAYY